MTATPPPLRPLRYFVLLAIVFAAMALGVVYYLQAGAQAANAAAQEGSLIDLSSAIGYFVCAGLMAVLGGRHVIHRHWPLMVALCLLGMRELGWDKRFSTHGLFKSDTFALPDVSLLEQGVTLLVIFGVVALLCLLIKRYAKVFVLSALRLEAVSLITGFACAMLVAARTLDGLGRKLETFDVDLARHTETMTTITEEVIELGVPVLFILAFFAYRNLYLGRAHTPH